MLILERPSSSEERSELYKKPGGDHDVTFLCNVRVQYTDANAGHSTGRWQLYHKFVAVLGLGHD